MSEVKSEGCGAKIRPFPNDIELFCDQNSHDDEEQHRGEIHDYAFPGSVTTIYWYESDRRNFRGDYSPCPSPNCVLPFAHSREHTK